MIKKSLCLRNSCIEIFVSPNRENIYLDKRKVTSNIEESFYWLVKQIQSENTLMDKTIVYCKSIKDCGRLFTHFREKLGSDSFDVDSQQMLFGMYHHATLSKYQTRVLESFYDEHGPCRLIFATNALGMGINFKDVRHIIHYGPKREMEELVQQIGRAGRDGKPARATLMYHGHHLRNCDNSVKDLCKQSSGC